MKKNIVIGIPVLNEEKNIGKLLQALLKQNMRSLSWKIVIISDGSIDRTEAIVSELIQLDKRIRLIRGKNRLGKPERMNQLFAKSHADALVILDGDIHIKSDSVIYDLVSPILQERIDLTSGKAEYLNPHSYFERIMKVGINMWTEAKARVTDSEMYTCEGQIRAFSKRLYSHIVFPQYSADDVYPYLFCRMHGYTYRHVPKAVIYYGLPSNTADYIKQHTRYLHSESIQRKNFSNEIVTQNYAISLRDKLAGLRSQFLLYPVLVSLYLLLLLVPKCEVLFDTESGEARWPIVSTTKK